MRCDKAGQQRCGRAEEEEQKEDGLMPPAEGGSAGLHLDDDLGTRGGRLCGDFHCFLRNSPDVGLVHSPGRKSQ
eukprot:CAMPEP_0173428614 /NCGR_PEP_ID=MMETSP1357-20121228/7535_1 /TAXON_ID=77926 /ORGANISM="Hemiselmis rufescens, Strain PCC563" /LENGTH=73 /DNA_ID=CAMNT_0014392665 /DNA_START=164 /DNA_END=385 /DNA_ORIENTATION=-